MLARVITLVLNDNQLCVCVCWRHLGICLVYFFLILLCFTRVQNKSIFFLILLCFTRVQYNGTQRELHV